jgi:hypothetical protein
VDCAVMTVINTVMAPPLRAGALCPGNLFNGIVDTLAIPTLVRGHAGHPV